MDVPITAGGGGTDYDRVFKKHFGDRPTSFAHSAHLRSTGTQRDEEATGSSGGRGEVDEETHNKLQNLGYRIRARVNQGYNRTPTSTNPFGETGFSSERHILSNVTNTRRTWSRVQSAPSSRDFSTLKSSHIQVMTESTKRSRIDSDEDEEQTEQINADRRIAALPSLSFASTASSNSSLPDPPQTSWPTSHPQLQIHDTHMQDDKVNYDFSSHFNTTNF